MDSQKVRLKKAFTLIELMVVILIVGILAAVAIPMMRGRADTSKWTEGRTGAGSILTTAKAFSAEKGENYNFAANNPDLLAIGFTAGDLDGRYFSDSDYSISWNGFNDFEVTVVNTSGGSSGMPPSTPTQIVVDEVGVTTITP